MTCSACARRRAAVAAVVKRVKAHVASIVTSKPVVKHSIERETRNGRR